MFKFREAARNIKLFREFNYANRKITTTLGAGFGVSVFIYSELSRRKITYREKFLNFIENISQEYKDAISEEEKEEIERKLKNNEEDCEKILKIVDSTENIVGKIKEPYDVHIFLGKALGYGLLYGVYGRFWYLTLPSWIVYKIVSSRV